MEPNAHSTISAKYINFTPLNIYLHLKYKNYFANSLKFIEPRTNNIYTIV